MSTIDFDLLLAQAEAITAGEPDLIANLSNISALVYHELDDVNWVGFYLTRAPETLVLGPFQGKVACLRIDFGKGVCGAAAAAKETQLVTDVHEFPGHIACDSASNAEVVVPLMVDGQVVGVFDLDSPSVGRFSQHDADGLSKLGRFIEGLNWSQLRGAVDV
ncbi:GAF domain-containing protein [Pseudidiomarina terrestris]|uniref:GAF domain-containing protein n=1 Tax=Pseudidiomarina terrestris TaxID=2820060 RepID=A0AAW7QXX9_9GAMM|nr:MULTISPECIES: GAF domain-containing protein [unclassified Pseudidiomarina]MDN7123705.1 GAF domain-containing protein [Pseudidiomarina sp. 1APP75-32.1]MDN7126505.1 GAF domain-containing protein [Pseudidiomarina sp. 1APR75-33.1]MDN7128571.1 GAF domain-containing protein [Pseudidiomarina sp. 1APR75-15]MDN7135171.1 GAF domain-containing protein [Pseudidiomarina sp. 1ASP75-5]MDN7137840.1 GAF domain-containing protein [Pseudidiomarina sp. 1ASP75-14]